MTVSLMEMESQQEHLILQLLETSYLPFELCFVLGIRVLLLLASPNTAKLRSPLPPPLPMCIVRRTNSPTE